MDPEDMREPERIGTRWIAGSDHDIAARTFAEAVLRCPNAKGVLASSHVVRCVIELDVGVLEKNIALDFDSEALCMRISSFFALVTLVPQLAEDKISQSFPE